MRRELFCFSLFKLQQKFNHDFATEKKIWKMCAFYFYNGIGDRCLTLIVNK